MEWIIFGTVAFIVIGYLLYLLACSIEKRKHFLSFMEGLNLTGLPIVTLSNNGVNLNFVLDTGSAHSILQKDVLPKLIYKKTDFVCQLSGIDNILREEEKTVIMQLQYKDKVVSGLFVVSDLSACFNDIKKETGVQLHGLLGSNFFTQNKYIIDYNEMIAYSKKI